MKKRQRLLKSFSYAWDGIVSVIKSEKNMQIHLAAALLVCIVAWIVNISRLEWLILLLTIGVVFSLEMINTAIERVVDLVTPEFHPLAKAAKDIAAGAVFIFVILSVIMGLIIFLPRLFAIMV